MKSHPIQDPSSLLLTIAVIAILSHNPARGERQSLDSEPYSSSALETIPQGDSSPEAAVSPINRSQLLRGGVGESSAKTGGTIFGARTELSEEQQAHLWDSWLERLDRAVYDYMGSHWFSDNRGEVEYVVHITSTGDISFTTLSGKFRYWWRVLALKNSYMHFAHTQIVEFPPWTKRTFIDHDMKCSNGPARYARGIWD